MGTKARFAEWRKVDKLFVVRPPDWPKNVELSFTDKVDMIEWAIGAHVMLKDGNTRRATA